VVPWKKELELSLDDIKKRPAKTIPGIDGMRGNISQQQLYLLQL